MKNTLTVVAFAIAVLGMGISMPSCPGQQAMQDKIDALEKSNGELRKMIMTDDGAMKATVADTATVKTELIQMNQELQAQATRIGALEASVTDLKNKAAAPPP